MTEKYITHRSFKTYQCDRYGNIRPIILMNELQALADTHAEMLGVGRTFLVENKLAWVVTHYTVDIIGTPTEGEELTLITWPSAQDRVRATRDFEIRGSDGRLIIRASSQWVLIDINTRRLIGIREYFSDEYVIPERAIDCAFGKFPEFDIQKTHVMKCRYDDVDVNQHINNAVYAVWATESVGFEYRNTHKLKRIELNYRHEINANVPSVFVDVALSENISRHHIRMDDDTINADVVCYWE